MTCACYLARAGLKLLVLERYRAVGGMTVTEEETLPGFWSDIHASGYQLAYLSPVPLELRLLDRYELIEPEIPFSQSGEEIPVAQLVVSNVDPGHLVLDLLGANMVGQEIVRKMQQYEWGDSVFVMFVALDSPINYNAGPALADPRTFI